MTSKAHQHITHQKHNHLFPMFFVKNITMENLSRLLYDVGTRTNYTFLFLFNLYC